MERLWGVKRYITYYYRPRVYSALATAIFVWLAQVNFCLILDIDEGDHLTKDMVKLLTEVFF